MKNDRKEGVQGLTMDTLCEADLSAEYADDDVIILDGARDISRLVNINLAGGAVKPDMYAFVLCTQGRMQCSQNSRPVALERDRLMMCPPHVIISDVMVSPDFDCIMVCLTGRFMRRFLHTDGQAWNELMYTRNGRIVHLNEAVLTLLKSYYTIFKIKVEQQDTTFRQSIMQSLLQAALWEVMASFRKDDDEPEKPEPTDRFRRGKRLLEHFLELLAAEETKRHPVTYYAERLCVSAKYLTTVCSRHSGKTALDWIQEYALEDIRFYLADFDYSIKEVAARSGFDNLSFFGKYVRAHFGCSPTEYRRRLTERGATTTGV